MIAIELRFPAGRYHSTPWGRFVNEGAVEWPPSPWRIVRALLAVWHRKHADLDEGCVRRALAPLLEPPAYCLPAGAPGHSRHYMPTDRSPLTGKTVKVFDTFLSIGTSARIVVLWPDGDLRGEDRECLATLVGSLGYLGRAESWVEARLLDKVPSDATVNCRPLEGEEAAPGRKRVQVMVPERIEAYGAWCGAERRRLEERELAQRREKASRKGKDPSRVRLAAGDRARIDETIPGDLFSCLEMEISDIRDAGWSRPPGSRRVDYELDPEGGEIRAGRLPAAACAPAGAPPTAVRFALASDTVHGDARPLLTSGLYLAETMRRCLMSQARDEEGATSEAFSGKDARGRPLQGHRHAYVLTCDDDDDGRIDHVLVYRREGFDERELRAFGRVRRLWQYKQGPDLFPVLVGVGNARDFDGAASAPGPACLRSAAVWVSRTPLLLGRHPKRNGRDSAEEQIRRELAETGFPDPARVEAGANGTRTRRRFFRWSEFARVRKRGGGAPALTQGFGFRIVFPVAVHGPIALGYGAHFGLGMFVPEAGAAPTAAPAGRGS